MADKTVVEAPKSVLGDHQYDRDCRAALSPLVDKLVEEATSAGWDPLRVGYELLYLASDKIGQLKGDSPNPVLEPEPKSGRRAKAGR